MFDEKNKGKFIIFCVWVILFTLKISLITIYVSNANENSIFLLSIQRFFFFGLLFVALFSLPKVVFVLIFYLICNLYYFAFLIYFDYNHTVFNIFMVWQIVDEGMRAVFLGGLSASPAALLLAIDLPLFVYCAIHYKQIHFCLQTRQPLRLASKEKKFSLAFFLSAPVFIILLVIGLLPPGPGILFGTDPKNSQTSSSYLTFQYGTLVASFYDYLVLNKIEDLLSRQVIGEVNKSEAQAQTTKPDSPPNFVIIQMESVQSNLIHRQHNGQPVMPYLDKLSRESVYYPFCFSYHKWGGTSDAEIAVMDNLDPLPAVNMVSKDYPHPNSFVKILTASGYQAIAFHNYIKSYYNRESSYKRLGFDSFYDFHDMNMTGPLWGSEDREMFEFIAGDFKAELPFFFYIINLSTHVGYGHINRYHQNPIFDDIENTRYRDALNCFNYLDQQLSIFIPEMRKKYPNTYFFLFGDHSTPNLYMKKELEKSVLKHNGNFFEFVPLLIVTPDDLGRTFRQRLASFHDIGPTILALLPPKSRPRSYKAYGVSALTEKWPALSLPYNHKSYDRAEIRELLPRVFK